MRRLFQPWFQNKPPKLGAVLDGLVMAVVLAPFTLFRGPAGRQVPLLAVVVALFVLLSYGARVLNHQRTTSTNDHGHDEGGGANSGNRSVP